MSMAYAGIGSRSTPEYAQKEMSWIASRLEMKGYTLRSGGAKGADQAFERGVVSKKEIYLPWKGFEGNKSELAVHSKKAYDMAKQFHPAWQKLTPVAIKFMARNSHQVMGKNMDDPVDFVLCWTPEGEICGGTGQAIRIAKFYNIPVINIFYEMWYENLMEVINGRRKDTPNQDIKLPKEPGTPLLLF